MQTVDKSIVEKKNSNLKESDESKSYTSLLNSAIYTTKQNNIKNNINRFFYSIGEYNFLFEENLKVENIPLKTINKLPHTAKWCSGIINIRGVIMPVVDMHYILKNHTKFKAPNKDKSKEKKNHNKYLIMIEHKLHAPLVLQIDKLPESVDIEEYTGSKPTKLMPNWLERRWKNSANTLLEVNHDTLFQYIQSQN